MKGQAQVTGALLFIFGVAVLAILAIFYVASDLSVLQNPEHEFTVDGVLFYAVASDNYTLEGAAGNIYTRTDFLSDGLKTSMENSLDSVYEVNSDYEVCMVDQLGNYDEVIIDVSYRVGSTYGRQSKGTFSYPSHTDTCTVNDGSCVVDDRVVITAKRNSAFGNYNVNDGLHSTVLDANQRLCFTAESLEFSDGYKKSFADLTINQVAVDPQSDGVGCLAVDGNCPTTGEKGFWSRFWEGIMLFLERLKFWEGS